MAFGKLIGDKLYLAPKILEDKGKQYINPTDDLYIELGYLPLEYINAPISKDGYTTEFSWINLGDKIQQVWRYEIDPKADVVKLIKKINELEDKIASTPITYFNGMEVDEKKFYTDGKITVKAIASGTPTGLNDTNFFD